MNRAEKAYEAFRDITTNPFTRTNTSKLSFVYSIVCNAERDAEYKKELESYIAPDASGMNVLQAIDAFFNEFNNTYGLDIRSTLTPFCDPKYPDGLYFNVFTYKKEGEKMIPVSPVDYKAGDVAYIRAVVQNLLTDEAVTVPRIKYTAYSEDGYESTGEKEFSAEIEFSLTCSRAGSVIASISACDENGEKIAAAESAAVGAIFDFEAIKPSHSEPRDFKAFWRQKVEEMKKTLPTDTALTSYSGDVAFEFDVDKTNYYHIRKADADYMALLRSKRLTTYPDSILDSFELWEVSLKAPGPCPATGYISIPKNAPCSSLPIRMIFAGYSAHAPQPFFDENCIYIYSTHHGYPCALSDEECYNALNKGILSSYGFGNGKPNSMFDNPSDCYMLYLHLRNLQMLRFAANASLSFDIRSVAEKWNGNLELTGGSLGGHQVIGVAALAGFLDERLNITSAEAYVPARCNYAAEEDKRIINPIGGKNAKNAIYFDSVHLASLIDAPVNISRCALGDTICPSSGICMAYNNFKGPKEIHFLQNSSHGYRPKNEKELWTVRKG